MRPRPGWVSSVRAEPLVAKDAISTGWDCPRAEVMVSFRPAQDKTHITQLLGRMVRTPLARRIPGNERLNAVDCLLPHFNKKSVEAVVTTLMTGSDGGEELPGRRVLINPREMKPNPAIPEEVWQKLLSLPSQTLPKRQARPVKRLTALAHELAADGLLPDAGKEAHAEMHKVLDGIRGRYAEEIKKAREGVLTVEGKTVRIDVKSKAMSFNDFVEEADYAVIEDAYKRAARVISPDLARTYSEHLAKKAPKEKDPEDALIEAHTIVAAVGLVPDLRDHVEAEAENSSNQWLTQFRVAIKSLSDERQDVYRQIREMSVDPLDVDLARSNTWLQPTTAREPDGREVKLPCFERHLLCDEDGLFPENFKSSWEPKVLLAELQRPGSIAWYRNPSRASQDSLGITYEDGTEVNILRPDFIFFAQRQNGTIVADIVDPHGIHFGDALPRLRGLARYAEENPGIFRRIEVVAQVGNKFRTIDLTEAPARAAVLAAKTVREVYEHDVAIDYSA
jgi:type III restriction enzyme